MISLCISFNLFSQDQVKIEQSKILLSKTDNDSLKCELLIKLSGLYSSAVPDSALLCAEEAIEISLKTKDKRQLSRSYQSLGSAYYYKADYPDALKNYFKSLKISEELNNIKDIGAAYNNIGNVYWIQKNYDGALEFYFKDLKISKELGNEIGAAKTIGNIGIIYDYKGDSEKALEYYLKSAEMSEKLGDKEATTNAFINIGTVYQEEKKLDEAIEYFMKAHQLAKESNNKNAIALVLINGGSCYLDMNDYLNAEIYLNKSVTISKEIGSKNFLRYAYKFLSELYFKQKDYKTSFEYYRLYVREKDSIFNEETSKQMAEMQTLFETEKKQKQIEIQTLKLNQQELEINKKKIIIYTVSAGLTLMFVLVFLIFRSYRQKKKVNAIILEKNIILEQANEEITAQRDEIESQRDEIIRHSDIVIYQKEKIEDSIRYAKRIQTAVLPADIYADSILGEYFIIFRPKDVVSGDFYWATQTEEWTVLTVADCTGHGVPGAFMSMLGVSFLNEIVRKKDVTNASDVLNHLRTYVIEALKQTGEEDSQKDGMDMSIIAIHKDTKKAVWAGANNPLWIIRNTAINKEYDDSTDMIEEIKSDKMPVAVHIIMDEFTNHEIQLETDDRLYLFTDGYSDQFGGPKGRKFMSKKLKRLIAETSAISMKEQGEQLEKELDKWINYEDLTAEGKKAIQKHEQIDDITVVGIKV